MRRALARDRREFDPLKVLKDATAAAMGLCKERFEAFGFTGQAPRIRPVPALEEMARQYPGKTAAVSRRVPGANTRT